MVTKVGSAGQVIESVIQYQQAAQTSKPETAADSVPDKKEAPEIKKARLISLAPERNRNTSEIAGEVKARNATQNKVGDPASLRTVPSSGAAVMETADGEIIENRDGLELSQETVKMTVDDVNKKLVSQGASVEFSFHEKTGRYSFKVVDTQSGEVLREVPPQKSLDMVAKMFELAGLIIDEKR